MYIIKRKYYFSLNFFIALHYKYLMQDTQEKRRLRNKRYYDKNKERINSNRRELYKKGKDCIKEDNIT